MELKDCFKEDFILWLVKSNKPKSHLHNVTGMEYQLLLNKLVQESLSEILDILLKEPGADYFWYNHPEYGSKLTYSIPSDGWGPVPGDALRVDKEKIKVFLRDIKIETVLSTL